MADGGQPGGDGGTAKKRLGAVGDFLIGYRVSSDDFKELRFGPQPFEGTVSDVCEAFGCTPDVALRQDARLVNQILEYRSVKAALRLANGGDKGNAELQKHPELLELLRTIDRAQRGLDP